MYNTYLFKKIKNGVIVENYDYIFYLTFTLGMFVMYVCTHIYGECVYSCKVCGGWRSMSVVFLYCFIAYF